MNMYLTYVRDGGSRFHSVREERQFTVQPSVTFLLRVRSGTAVLWLSQMPMNLPKLGPQRVYRRLDAI